MGKKRKIPIAKGKKQTVSPATQEQNNSREISNETEPECVPDLECRICLQEKDPQELVSPCNCKGSIAYVHQGCENCLIQYELIREGLKPLSQLSLPRPISHIWSDIVTFCFTLFVIVFYTIFLIVATTFWIRHGDNMLDVPTRADLKSHLVILIWWFSVPIQSVAYFYSIYIIFRRWIEENYVYEWKEKYRKKRGPRNRK